MPTCPSADVLRAAGCLPANALGVEPWLPAQAFAELVDRAGEASRDAQSLEPEMSDHGHKPLARILQPMFSAAEPKRGRSGAMFLLRH